MKETSNPLLSSLWEIVLKQFKEHTKNGVFFNSICYAIQRSAIHGQDFIRLNKDFNDNKPSNFIHEKFFKHPSFTGTNYWWHGVDASNQRQLFIKKMIKLNLEKEKVCQQSENPTLLPITN